MEQPGAVNSSSKFECKNCNYTTIRQSQYTRHLMTALHKRRHMEPDECNTATEFVCSCGNKYKYKRGLSKHKQKCYGKLYDNTFRPNIEQYDAPNIQIKVLTETIIDLVKQNQEFKDIMIEQTKHMMELANKAGNNNCNNPTNNKFNLNVFLNETCKDAISMDDFINSIEVTRDEFIHTGQVGFVEGISTVMAHRFRDMEMHTRPLHCTDLKRETIYIKNADKWEKDDADKTNMRKAVRGVARKNMKELWRWYNDNKPEVEQIGSDVCEDYFKYHKAALGGYGKEEDLKFEDKIMRNVLKEVQVDKSSSLTI